MCADAMQHKAARHCVSVDHMRETTWACIMADAYELERQSALFGFSVHEEIRNEPGGAVVEMRAVWR